LKDLNTGNSKIKAANQAKEFSIENQLKAGFF